MYKRSRALVLILQKTVLALAILGAVVPTLFPEFPYFLRSLWVLLPLTVIWVLTPLCKRYYQVVLLHILLAGACILISGGIGNATQGSRGTTLTYNGMMMLVGIVFSAVRMLLSLLTLREKEDGTGRMDLVALLLPVFLFFPAVFLAEKHGIFPWCRTYYTTLFSLYLILLFIRLFLSRSAEFVDANRHTSQMPLGQMSRVNHRLLLIFLAAAAGLFFLLPYTHLQSLLAWIPQVLLWLLRLIVGLLSRRSSTPEEEPAVTPHLPNWAPEGEGTTSPFLMLLGQILGTLVIIAVAAAALLALYRFLSSRIRHPELPDLDVREYLGADERATRLNRRGGAPLSWYDYSPSGRARRAWIRELLGSRKKDSLRRSQSPAELENAAGITADGALHDLYEKARYSENGISREEWESFRAR